ncbi:MAG: hypothetical protein M1816_003166 [Peltula sp. TS41687]|nr:MAG: hypothetical protein M1816_003166 [Peltula sp. TS41687]
MITNKRIIEPFQKGETKTFIEHIKTGIKVLSETKDALLVFSGGPTKPHTRLSEAQSYLNLVQANAFFNHPHPSSTNITTESLSLDSYQNVLFSLLTFHAYTGGVYPTHLAIVTHDFKRARFLDLHLPALRWPRDRVCVVGIDPPTTTTSRLELEEGERLRGWDLWRRDPYGVGWELRGKRRVRDVWGLQTEEEGEGEGHGVWIRMEGEGVGAGGRLELGEGVGRLLGWKGPERFEGRLPWDGEGG